MEAMDIPEDQEKNGNSSKDTEEAPRKKAKYESDQPFPVEVSDEIKKERKEYARWLKKKKLTQDYTMDIYNRVKKLQIICEINPAMMLIQESVTHPDRGALIDWLSHVADSFKLPEEVLFLCIQYIDIFLSNLSVRSEKFQLLGIAAFHIAAKFEDAFYDKKISYLLRFTDGSYTTREFVHMELQILEVVKFDLAQPTASGFLDIYETFHFIPRKMYMLALYLCELSSLDGCTFLAYPPSVIASASLALSRYNFGHTTDIWTPYKHTWYPLKHLHECMWDLHKLLLDAPNFFQNVREKYQRSRYHQVSFITPKELTKELLQSLR